MINQHLKILLVHHSAFFLCYLPHNPSCRPLFFLFDFGLYPSISSSNAAQCLVLQEVKDTHRNKANMHIIKIFFIIQILNIYGIYQKNKTDHLRYYI